MSKIKYKTKKRRTNLKRGGNLKSEERRIFKEYMKCRHKIGLSVFDKYKFKTISSKKKHFKSISSKKMYFKELRKLNDKKIREFKKTHKKEIDNYNKRSKKNAKICKKQHTKQKGELKKKFKKETKKINNSKKCCKCRYVKTNKTLRKVRGPWPHCSYDMSDCCKDKKIIIS
mgnify:CR=1 FL=1